MLHGLRGVEEAAILEGRSRPANAGLPGELPCRGERQPIGMGLLRRSNH
jgi:hypothetical protein